MVEVRKPTERQLAFLRSGAFEVLYGGAAGGGKTSSLIMAPLRWVDQPRFRALLLRRTVPDLERSDSLIEQTRDFYPGYGAVYSHKRRWLFPSGARIDLGTMERADDRFSYRGTAYQFIGFDELTTFEEQQYIYLISRMRGRPGVKMRLRAGTNPDGPGHDWVLKRWAPWLYPEGNYEYDGPRAKPGEVLWFARDSSGVDVVVPKGTDGARSRTFIPSLASDNPHVSTDYVLNLKQLDALSRAQLLEGDWMARSAAGAYFKRAWVADNFVDACPARVVSRVRYWDRAATAANDPNAKGAAWTAGVRMSRTEDGFFWVEDVRRGQWSPGQVENEIKATAETDHRLGTRLVLERDPAQAGKFEAFHYSRLLAGFDVHTVPPQGDKVTRFKPVSAQAEAGNVRIVRGRWNEALLNELESFPDGLLDQADATSGAFSQCMRTQGSVAKTGGARPLARAQGGF